MIPAFDPRGRGSLYGRFYLVTLFLCFLTLFVSFAAITARRRLEWHETLHRLSKSVSIVATDQLVPHLGDGKVPAVLADLAEQLDANVTLLDPDGKRLDSIGASLTVPTAEELNGARRDGYGSPHRRNRWLTSTLHLAGLFSNPADHWAVVPIARKDQLYAFLQFSPAHPAEARATTRLAITLASILAAVALLMIPFTRSVTLPLERLTASARRFGTGDFAHRLPIEGPREVARLGSEMNEMAERLSAVLHTQQQLLADVSHELRSPLARIEVALELARDQGGAVQPLQSIQDDIAELIQLVQDILAASRLELRPDLVRLRDVDATELIEEARAKAIAAGLPPEQLTLEDRASGARVQADRDLVAHALTNLLDNARRHTPEQTSIVLGTRAEGDRVLFFVKDAGQGIPPEELPRLFEPFYRPDQSRARNHGGGAGLGLSLVRRIAELHGGKPFVESAIGLGSTFGMTVARA